MPERILLIEDDPAVRGVLQRALSRAGYEVSAAHNGRDALNAGKLDAVQLVITDVEMPEMNGIELLQHIRQRAPELPVMVLSGAWAGYLEDAALLGADAVLQKPVVLDDLFTTVRRLLDGKAGRPG